MSRFARAVQAVARTPRRQLTRGLAGVSAGALCTLSQYLHEKRFWHGWTTGLPQPPSAGLGASGLIVLLIVFLAIPSVAMLSLVTRAPEEEGASVRDRAVRASAFATYFSLVVATGLRMLNPWSREKLESLLPGPIPLVDTSLAIAGTTAVVILVLAMLARDTVRDALLVPFGTAIATYIVFCWACGGLGLGPVSAQ